MDYVAKNINNFLSFIDEKSFMRKLRSKTYMVLSIQ